MKFLSILPKPNCHLFHIVMFVTGTISSLHKVDMKAFRGLSVVSISTAKGPNSFHIVLGCMELWYVEMLSNFKINENLLIIMKDFQAFFKNFKGF